MKLIEQLAVATVLVKQAATDRQTVNPNMAALASAFPLGGSLMHGRIAGHSWREGGRELLGDVIGSGIGGTLGSVPGAFIGGAIGTHMAATGGNRIVEQNRNLIQKLRHLFDKN
jgi:hypothetical protein